MKNRQGVWWVGRSGAGSCSMSQRDLGRVPLVWKAIKAERKADTKPRRKTWELLEAWPAPDESSVILLTLSLYPH